MSSQLVLEGVEPPPPESPDFATLRSARGWSEQDVAERLKISVAKVRAIEKLDFAALPDGPYTRGFIRNYARLLETDPSPWLNLLDAALPPAPRALPDDPRRLAAFDDTGRSVAMTAQLMWWGAAALVVAIALFLAWWERGAWLPHVQGLLPNQSVQASVPGPATAPSPAAGSTTETITLPAQTQAAVDGVASPAAAAAVPTPAAPTPAAPEPRLDVPAGHKAITLAFAADAWVEVRDSSGKTLVSQLNKAGSQHAFTGQPPLRFTVGSAKDVSLQVDGSNFDMGPHLKNDVARFVVN
ncbi:MAG: helix-turn-helix domain-containing protein [Burkholderiaceae bacterium]